MDLPSGSAVKNLIVMQEMQVWSLGWEDPLKKEKTIHSSILAWEIPWTVYGVAKRAEHDLATKQQQQQNNNNAYLYKHPTCPVYLENPGSHRFLFVSSRRVSTVFVILFWSRVLNIVIFDLKNDVVWWGQFPHLLLIWGKLGSVSSCDGHHEGTWLALGVRVSTGWRAPPWWNSALRGAHSLAPVLQNATQMVHNLLLISQSSPYWPNGCMEARVLAMKKLRCDWHAFWSPLPCWSNGFSPPSTYYRLHKAGLITLLC